MASDNTIKDQFNTPSKHDISVFIFSIVYNDEYGVKGFLDKYGAAAVNVKDSDLRTPLMRAVESGQIEIAELLLKRGASLEEKDKFGETALHVAAACGLTEIAKLLLRHGADIEAQDKGGNTPLILASSTICDSIVAVGALLDQGANPNAKNKAGNTSLMLAAGEGEMDRVQLLLVKDADARAENKSGKTAMKFASENGHKNIAAMLEGAAVAQDQRAKQKIQCSDNLIGLKNRP